MLRMTKKKYAVVGAIGAVALTVGAAFAYWTSTGSSTATGTTGTDGGWGVVVTNTTNNLLSPDGATDTYTYVLTNNSDGVARLEAQPTIGLTNDKSGDGCDSSWYEVIPTVAASTADVAANGTTGGTFTVQLKNENTNQDACKNAVVTLTVSVP